MCQAGPRRPELFFGTLSKGYKVRVCNCRREAPCLSDTFRFKKNFNAGTGKGEMDLLVECTERRAAHKFTKNKQTTKQGIKFVLGFV